MSKRRKEQGFMYTFGSAKAAEFSGRAVAYTAYQKDREGRFLFASFDEWIAKTLLGAKGGLVSGRFSEVGACLLTVIKLMK